jgi:hypothetical protein
MAVFSIKQNDTAPALQASLFDASGAALDLSGASARFHLRKRDGTTTLIDAAATIVTASPAVVSYSWAAGDTDTVGEYEAEFEITYADSTVETFPNRGYILVRIWDDIA